MACGQTDQPKSIVPLPRFCAVLGYVLFCLFAFSIAAELSSRAVVFVWAYYKSPDRNPVFQYCRGTGDNNCPVAMDFWGRWLNVMSASPAYDGRPWAEEFWREERPRWRTEHVPYEPFRLWGVSDWHTKYVSNVVSDLGRVRATTNTLNPSCGGKKVLQLWVFGGSTTWGTGTPDFATLPSYLSHELNVSSSRCFVVENLGVEGYSSNQEVIYLMQLLKAGHRPDIIVFYDGINDATYGAVTPGIALAHGNYYQIKAALEETSVLRPLLEESFAIRGAARVLRYLIRPGPSAGAPDFAQKARETIENYENNVGIVRRLADGYGFRVFFFWQPELLYGQKPPVPFEAALEENPAIIAAPLASSSGAAILRAQRAVYDEARIRALASGKFEFMGAIFDSVREPIYVDWAHLGPRGNEIVAGAIAARILAGAAREPN